LDPKATEPGRRYADQRSKGLLGIDFHAAQVKASASLCHWNWIAVVVRRMVDEDPSH
jgi:hypothetical protein